MTLLPFRVRSNRPNAINRCDFVRTNGLKTNRHFLLLPNEIRRELVLNVKEFSLRASGWTALDCLFAHVLTINKDFKRAFTALFSVISDECPGRMCRINWQIEREPLLSAPRGAAEEPIYGRFFTLLIEFLFLLRIARLQKGDRRRFQTFLPGLFGGELGDLSCPRIGVVEVPIDGVSPPMESIERNQIDFFGLTVEQTTGGAVISRLVSV